jgi:hypothetical protein
MRIYVRSGAGVWSAVAPEIPGTSLTGHESWATRDEAIERCRALVAGEVAAYERLGVPLQLTDGEEVIDWMLQVWMIPEYLIPLRPAQLRAAVVRMDDIAAELERDLDALTPEQWDRRDGEEWSVRISLDHLASGMGVGIQQLEPLPLDQVAAHAEAFEELRARLGETLGRRFAVDQFGTNAESRRIKWTPRKVARVVGDLQRMWTAHLAGAGEEPGPRAPHDDRDGDDAPLAAADIETLADADRVLRADPRSRLLTYSYRYYRHRLDPWPDDVRERWRAMHRAFRDQLLSSDDTELARIRMLPLGPFGPASTVRGELRLGIGHVLGHIAQIRAAGSRG